MSKYDNIKNKGFDHRSTEELREIQSRGGRNSGEARRRKANFRKTLNLLLTARIDSPEWTSLLESLGLDTTLESAINAAMIKKALTGDVKAYEAIAKYSGQTTQTEADDIEQKIRTDRARQARNQEIGDTFENEENIRNFLNAMRPSDEELKDLFREASDGE